LPMQPRLPVRQLVRNCNLRLGDEVGLQSG